jgi:hypothetical protein
VWFTYTWEVLKCGTGEEWGRYVGTIVWGKKYYLQPRRREEHLVYKGKNEG